MGEIGAAGRSGVRRGRLKARPGAMPRAAVPAGLQPLGLGTARDGLRYVPSGYRPEAPAPLLVVLHGAGAAAVDIMRPFIEPAERGGVVLLAPDSRGSSWDLILGGYGPDVQFIDAALQQTFSRFAIDPHRLGIGGFSDGASYALSLGVINGTLFTHVMAFAPCFAAFTEAQGSPKLFVCHGIADRVLPIDRCSRQIVPWLERAGYEVDYREFEGGHVVPPDLVQAAFAWFLA